MTVSKPHNPPGRVDLCGQWKRSFGSVASREVTFVDFDDSSWDDIEVPSSSSSGETPRIITLRRRFEARGDQYRRSWLVFDGVDSQASVWLDGVYLGDIDAYFAPHRFEVTEALKIDGPHVVTVELTADETIGPWSNVGWHPGNLWGPVHIEQSGQVHIARLKVLCPEATPERAVISIAAELDSAFPKKVSVKTVVSLLESNQEPVVHEQTCAVASDANRLRWSVAIDDPHLWWPWELGEQPLYEVSVEVRDLSDDNTDNELSDTARLVTGLRHVAYEKGSLMINGDRLFVRSLVSGETTEHHPQTMLEDLRTAGANLTFVERWVESAGFYETADRLGMLVWQGMPPSPMGRLTTRAERLTRQAIEHIGHHPSVVAWVHPRRNVRDLRPKADALRRTIQRADPSRPAMELPEGWRFFHFAEDDVAAVMPKSAKRSRLIRFASAPRETASHLDAIRRHKYKPVTGFMAELVSVELLDGACDPVRLLVHVPGRLQAGRTTEIDVYLVNDLHQEITEGTISANVSTSSEVWNWSWGGNVPRDAVAYIATMRFTLPLDATSLDVDLSLDSTIAVTKRASRLQLR